MSVLQRKLRRDLQRSWLVAVAIAAIISVGGICYVSMRTVYFNLRRAMIDYYGKCRMADFWISLKRAPLSELHARLHRWGVADWEGRIVLPARILLPKIVSPINATVVSFPTGSGPKFNVPMIRYGTGFSGKSDNEVIIAESFAKAYRLKPGDQLRLVAHRQERQLTIAGVAISSEFVYAVDEGSLLPDPRRYAVCYVPQRLAERWSDLHGSVNQIVGSFTAEGLTVQDSILRLLESDLEEFGVVMVIGRQRQLSHQMLSNEMRGLRAFSLVAPTIFLFAAGIVLHVFLGRLLRQQRTVIGTLAALGYTRSELLFHYVQLGMVIGVLGAVGGSVFGQLASIAMTHVYRGYFEFPDLRSGLYLHTHLLSVLAALVTACAGSFQAITTILRLQPAHAMRPEPPRYSATLAMVPWRWLPSWLSIGWRIVFRNVARRPGRTVASLVASSAGASFLVAGLMFVSSLHYFLEFQFEKVSRGDVDFQFGTERDWNAWQEIQRLVAPGVAEPVLLWPCTLVHGHRRRLVAITALQPNSLLTVPYDRYGRRIPLPESGLVLSRKLADSLAARPGDYLQLISTRGDQRLARVMVSRIADSFLGMEAYCQLQFLHRTIRSSLVVNRVQADLLNSHSAHDKLWDTASHMPAIQSIRVQRDTVDTLRKTFVRHQFMFIGLLVTFAGVIFFGNVLNALFVSFGERTTEVATLRALGYSSSLVGLTFLEEAMLVNATATALGVIGGYLLTLCTSLAYENEFVRLPIVVRPWNVTVTLGLAMIFTCAAYAILYFALKRIRIAEVLNVRE